jgi:hypothetical protein
MAAVTLARGLNASVLHRWMKEAERRNNPIAIRPTMPSVAFDGGTVTPQRRTWTIGRQTLTRLRALKLDGMAHAFEEQISLPSTDALPFEDHFPRLLEELRIARGEGGATIADAVLDRLLRQAHRLTLKGESLRRTKRQKARAHQSPIVTD